MKHILLIFTVLLLFAPRLSSQELLAEQQPGTLFAYPLAPDTCSTLEERCNYIITHFWDNFDISKPITDDAALEVTFRDYVDFFRYAHRNVVLSSVRDLVNKAQSNTANLQKLGEMAELCLYGTDAEYWSDEVYVAFIKPLAGSKQLPKQLREHYAQQLARINSVQVGAPAYILLFVDDSADSSIGRVRMSTDVALNALVDSGEVALVCMCLNKYSEDWARTGQGFGQKWIVGCNDDLADKLDLRVVPCCYILGEDRKVLNKAQSVEGILSAVNPAY